MASQTVVGSSKNNRPWRPSKGWDATLIAVVFLTYAYFYNGAGPVQNSRLSAIFSFVEPGDSQGTFQLDRFLRNRTGYWQTAAWIRHSGHRYSTLAPGPTLLGTLGYAPLYRLEQAQGYDPTSPSVSLVNAWLLHLLVTVLPAALVSPVFFRLMLYHGANSIRRAWWMTVLFYLGTAMFPYSTQLWGGPTATACVIPAVYLALKPGNRPAAMAGLFAGFALLCDYACIVTFLSLVILILSSEKPLRMLPFTGGSVAPLLLFTGYHQACFGTFLGPAARFGLGEQGAMALMSPLFSADLGLFLFMPVLIMVLHGIVARRAQHETRVYWLSIANIVGYVVIAILWPTLSGVAPAGFHSLIPALPFFLLLMSPPPSLRLRWLERVLAAVSMATMLVLASQGPLEPSEAIPWTGQYAQFLGPDWPLRLHPIRAQTNDLPDLQWLSSFTPADLVGLRGRWSAAPWVLLAVVGWGLATVLLFRQRPRP